MYKIYLFACILACVIFLFGFKSGIYTCEQKHYENEIRTFQESQQTFMQTKKDIHEKVYKTGVRDIRNILHDKYTIAQ